MRSKKTLCIYVGMDIHEFSLQGIDPCTGSNTLVVSHANNPVFAKSPLCLTLLNPPSPESMLDTNTPRYVLIRAQSPCSGVSSIRKKQRN